MIGSDVRNFVFLLSSVSVFVPAFLFAANAIAAPKEMALVKNPLVMTMTAALAMPSKANFRYGKVNALPGRRPVPLFKEKHDLEFRYSLQNNLNAPLIFVIPGLGGLASSAPTLFLAEKFYRQGYQAVTIDNRFAWKIVIAASQLHFRDLFRPIQKISTTSC